MYKNNWFFSKVISSKCQLWLYVGCSWGLLGKKKLNKTGGMPNFKKKIPAQKSISNILYQLTVRQKCKKTTKYNEGKVGLLNHQIVCVCFTPFL